MDRETLFKIKTRERFEKINVPAWGGMLGIRIMTAGERDQVEQMIDPNSPRDDTTFMYEMVIKCVVNHETGEQMFMPDDADQIRELPAPGFVAVCRECMRINGIGEFADVDSP